MFWKNLIKKQGQDTAKKRGRILLHKNTAVYHVVSKTAYHDFRFFDSHKKVFRDMLERQAEFCGIEILAFCILDNHFHLLLRIPYLEHALDDNELIRRYKALYSGRPLPKSALPVDEVIAILANGGSSAKALRKRLLARMMNLPNFIKELKQRFSIWYNNHFDNVGTLWCEPFKSVLVEDVPSVLKLVAAYIDLNPARADICKDPEEYPYSTIGAASQGSTFARRGLLSIYATKKWTSVLKKYRYLLSNDQPLRPETQLGREDVYDILGQGLTTPIGLLLRQRIQAFSQGGIIGTSQFVEEVETFLNKKLSHKKRFTPKPIYTENNGGCAFHSLYLLPIPLTY